MGFFMLFNFRFPEKNEFNYRIRYNIYHSKLVAQAIAVIKENICYKQEIR